MDVLCFFLLICTRINRTEEEFRTGHVEDSLNVPYLFFTPQGKTPKQLNCRWQYISGVSCPIEMFSLSIVLYGMWLFFLDSAGREKNPKFIEQIATHFNKEDIIVVVLLIIYLPIDLQINYIYRLCDYGHMIFILLVLVLIHILFSWKGCKSGVRSELACFDLMAAVRSLPPF